jgi:hypothetical protein
MGECNRIHPIQGDYNVRGRHMARRTILDWRSRHAVARARCLTIVAGTASLPLLDNVHCDHHRFGGCGVALAACESRSACAVRAMAEHRRTSRSWRTRIHHKASLFLWRTAIRLQDGDPQDPKKQDKHRFELLHKSVKSMESVAFFRKAI